MTGCKTKRRRVPFLSSVACREDQCQYWMTSRLTRKKGMKTIFLFIFTLTFVQGSHAKYLNVTHWNNNLEDLVCTIEPCLGRSSIYTFIEFVRRHVVNKAFDRNSREDWEKYLEKNNLCGRVPVQSFIDASEGQVCQICRSAGYRVATPYGSDWGISMSTVTVHAVASHRTDVCKVTSVRTRHQPVVLACSKVGNQCFPVHYEPYRGQRPTNQVCM